MDIETANVLDTLTNVQIDSVRDDVRMVAEHLVALGSKVDSFRR